MGGPLDGVRVLDLSQIVSGPYSAMMLSDLGAEVIKVEAIESTDPLRTGLFQRGGLAALYLNNNRGKRVISVDIRTEAGRDIVLDLVQRTDVVVQNMRPGVLDRLGLGYADCTKRNEQIIYCSISGYGTDGPWAQRPVLDPVIQGVVGIVARQKSEAIPIPDLVRMVIADKWAAQMATQAVLAALFCRERTGQGQHIDLSMLDTALYLSWPDLMMDYTHLGEGVSPGLRVVDIYQLTDCLDAKLIYFCANNNQLRGVLRALGRGELCEDPRFSTSAATAKPENFEALGAIIVDEFSKVRRDEVLARLVENDVPCGPILEPDEVPFNEQIVHNKSLVEWEHPEAGVLRQPRSPIHFSGTPTEFKTGCAQVGQHTDEVLLELGRTTADIAALRSAGQIA
ncbi:CaiB/BaiF CoA transferase family protein [Mycolicibacterium pyrenivorans]|uniref:CaiB/BaiF CoA transferase family protein n=1 Tax=Mycolicibacterium pyrenivorans TaxID=187102 RepID=UPI0021F3C6F2|nr:CaiB/BaiF CoA-transferase family protein [Mycolicibacterium pyrenivorans]MCV7154652.1 CoA transferase [Mycolicibacterium pyrenivorans]